MKKAVVKLLSEQIQSMHMPIQGGKGSKACLNGALKYKKDVKMTPEAIYSKFQELASISAWLRQIGHIKRLPA